MVTWRLAAIILPVVGLAGLWGWSDYQSRQGTEWEVPIQGYDPRDLLRGHYVEFTYDWPGSDDWAADAVIPLEACLEGTPPGPPTLVQLNPGDACEYPVEADFDGVYGESSLLRGRLYVGQDRAAELEEKLLDPEYQGFVRIRLGTNRRITPLDIRFERVDLAPAAEQ